MLGCEATTPQKKRAFRSSGSGQDNGWLRGRKGVRGGRLGNTVTGGDMVGEIKATRLGILELWADQKRGGHEGRRGGFGEAGNRAD